MFDQPCLESRNRKQARELITAGNLYSVSVNDDLLRYPAAWEGEALLVQTDEIQYLAFVYKDQHQQYQSSGFILFPDGEMWFFSLGDRLTAGVRGQCLSVSRQIARLYGGVLEHGEIDIHGRFIKTRINRP
ncbi:MAG: hypothetical protein SWH61_05525 [Thermodesulfobacteriota bacterium]|nr:hypothetical protein [Thermodesulfobacteriota bacterium]